MISKTENSYIENERELKWNKNECTDLNILTIKGRVNSCTFQFDITMLNLAEEIHVWVTLILTRFCSADPY